jgi:4'-phosphopantetheinyl transferase
MMSITPTIPAPLRVAQGEVHIWSASLDLPSESCERLYPTLSEDERSRSARFRFEHDRQRYLVAHGALRDLLGRYLGTDPRRVRFTYNSFGKPALDPQWGSRLKFNLSHSAGLALIAIATDADIGIDVEFIRALPEYGEIAGRFFSASEFAEFNRLPEGIRAGAFYNRWTRMEACVKAGGEGLGLPSTSHSEITPRLGWSLHTLRPAPGYIGAVAIAGSGWRLLQRSWQMQEKLPIG